MTPDELLARTTPEDGELPWRERVARTIATSVYGVEWQNLTKDSQTSLLVGADAISAISALPGDAGLRDRATSAAYLAIYGEGMEPLEHPEGWEYAGTVTDAILAALQTKGVDERG